MCSVHYKLSVTPYISLCLSKDTGIQKKKRKWMCVCRARTRIWKLNQCFKKEIWTLVDWTCPLTIHKNLRTTTTFVIYLFLSNYLLWYFILLQYIHLSDVFFKAAYNKSIQPYGFPRLNWKNHGRTWTLSKMKYEARFFFYIYKRLYQWTWRWTKRLQCQQTHTYKMCVVYPLETILAW